MVGKFLSEHTRTVHNCRLNIGLRRKFARGDNQMPNKTLVLDRNDISSVSTER